MAGLMAAFDAPLRQPQMLEATRTAATKAGFDMAFEPLTGALLCALAAAQTGRPLAGTGHRHGAGNRLVPGWNG